MEDTKRIVGRHHRSSNESMVSLYYLLSSAAYHHVELKSATNSYVVNDHLC